MAGDFRPVERVKNALDNRKLNLSTKCPADQSKWSSLIWGLYSNNPRITVYTNDPGDTGPDKGYGKISANLDLPIFAAFLVQLDKIIDGPNDVKFSIENKNFIFPGGKRSEKPVVVNTLWFGKNADGVVWISVVARERPKIQFKFGGDGNSFHNFTHGDGTAFSAGEWSQLQAKGYVRILENMVPTIAAANYVEPPKKDAPAGGGGYGGGNRSGGGGGGYGGGGGRSNGGGNSGGGADFGADGDLPF